MIQDGSEDDSDNDMWVMLKLARDKVKISNDYWIPMKASTQEVHNAFIYGWDKLLKKSAAKVNPTSIMQSISRQYGGAGKDDTWLANSTSTVETQEGEGDNTDSLFSDNGWWGGSDSLFAEELQGQF